MDLRKLRVHLGREAGQQLRQVGLHTCGFECKAGGMPFGGFYGGGMFLDDTSAVGLQAQNTNERTHVNLCTHERMSNLQAPHQMS